MNSRELPIYQAEARSILSPVSGFLAEARFTHSLTPARNCTFGCSYCYVPSLGLYGGLKPEDWKHWGQFTTFKTNAAALLRHELRANQVIYCSPNVDPYQPVEGEALQMPEILSAVIAHPPAVFVLQTRGVLVLRDLDLLEELGKRTRLRVSFSLTTDSDEVRRRYEPHCAPISERLEVIRTLRARGIETFAALAPLLPCNPESLAEQALCASGNHLIGDALHIRAVKRHGATTREAAHRISTKHAETEWLDPAFQAGVVERIRRVAIGAGRLFEIGPAGFSLLARQNLLP